MDLQAQIEKMNLQFGDVLLVQCPDENTAAIIQDVRKALEPIGKLGVLALIVPPGFNIRKLTEEEKVHLAKIVDECSPNG
jgi:hypothetical protein